MASGRTLPLEGPRSHPLTGDENQTLKPKNRRPGAQVALMVSSAEATASVEAASPKATTTSAPTTAARGLLSHQTTAKLLTASTNRLKNSAPDHAPGLRPGRMREQQGRPRHHEKH
jgi:hypothetical protein